MYLSHNTEDSKDSILRYYSFSERQDSMHGKADLSLKMIEHIRHNSEITKMSLDGLLYGETPRLYFNDFLITAKRSKKTSTLIGVGAKHYTRQQEGIHSLVRVRIHSADPALPFTIEQDPFIKDLALFLEDWEYHLKCSPRINGR